MTRTGLKHGRQRWHRKKVRRQWLLSCKVGVACYVQLEVMMVSEMWRCSKEEPDPERTASYAGVSDVPTPPGSPSTDTEALKCWSARVL